MGLFSHDIFYQNDSLLQWVSLCWIIAKSSPVIHTNKNMVVILALMATDLLSCQVVQVGQLLQMDLEVPENKQGNRRCRILLKKRKQVLQTYKRLFEFWWEKLILLLCLPKMTITTIHWCLGNIQPWDNIKELKTKVGWGSTLQKSIHTGLPETLVQLSQS